MTTHQCRDRRCGQTFGTGAELDDHTLAAEHWNEVDECPHELCRAPLSAAGVCPRHPAHTPVAWDALKPQQRGIFPGLPRGES